MSELGITRLIHWGQQLKLGQSARPPMPPSRLAVLTALPNRPNYSHSFGKASLSDSYYKEERDPGARQRKKFSKMEKSEFRRPSVHTCRVDEQADVYPEPAREAGKAPS